MNNYHFRFNADTVTFELQRQRTQKADQQEHKAESKPEINLSGGRGDFRWSFVRIKYRFEKVLLSSALKGRTWKLGLLEM